MRGGAARRDWGLGFQGVRPGAFKGAPGFWACVPRERRGEIPGGDHGVQLRGGGEEDDPDVWVRPGSEGGTGPTGGPGAQRDGGGRSAGVDVWVRVRRERGDARG